MSFVHFNPTTEFSSLTNGASPLSSIAEETSGLPVPASPTTESTMYRSEVKLFSAGSTIAKFSRQVSPIQRDISRAIAEAIDSVAIPAACRAAGRPLSRADFDNHGMMEQSVGKGTFGQSVEFYWRSNPALGMKGFRSIALLVVTALDNGDALIEAEAAPHLTEE